MKRFLALLVVGLVLTPFLLVAQTLVDSNFASGMGGWTGSSGTWAVRDGRLVQSDVTGGMTKAAIRVAQSGVMRYEFDVMYVGGAEQDGQGAFGIHAFADSLLPGKSWGNGKSILFWVTFDPRAYGVDQMAGTAFYGQVYKSTNHITMTRYPGPYSHIAIPAVSPSGMGPWMTYVYPVGNYRIPNPNVPVRVKIDVDVGAGEARVWDPVYTEYFYRVPLDKSITAGQYVILRTSGVAVSFDNIKVTKLR